MNFLEIEDLAKHGTMLPPNIMGLTEEQVEELKLKDEWGEKCVPMGGWTFNKDGVGTSSDIFSYFPRDIYRVTKITKNIRDSLKCNYSIYYRIYI